MAEQNQQQLTLADAENIVSRNHDANKQVFMNLRNLCEQLLKQVEELKGVVSKQAEELKGAIAKKDEKRPKKADSE